MPNEKNAFKVGLTVLLMLVLLLGVLAFLPNQFRLTSTVPFRVRFPHTWSLPTLQKDALVLVGGQKKGLVKSVYLREEPNRPADPAPNMPIPLRLFVIVEGEIDSEVPLYTDCTARAEGPPLGGIGQIVLEVGSNSERVQYIKGGEPIVVAPSPPGGLSAAVQTLNQTISAELNTADPHSLLARIKLQLDDTQANSLMTKFQRSMDDLNASTSSIRLQLDGRERDAIVGKLNAIMDHFNAITAALSEEFIAARPEAVLGKVHKALDSLDAGMAAASGMMVNSQAPVEGIVKRVENTTRILDEQIMPQIAQQVDARNPTGLIGKLGAGMDDFGATMKNVNEVSKVGRDVALLNRDNINEIVRNFSQTSARINSSVSFILRHPWLVFKAPTASETKQGDILEASRAYADAAARMDSALAQLRTLAETRGGDIRMEDEEYQRIRELLKESLSRFREAEAAFWKNLDIR